MSFGRILVCLMVTGTFLYGQTSLDGRRKALNDLLAERWEYQMRDQPEFASILGDLRFKRSGQRSIGCGRTAAGG